MPGKPNTKWKETQLKKFGSQEALTAAMREQGRAGGSVTGVRKGFAANHDLAVASGRKGGLISRRGRSEANYKFKKGIEYDEKRT